ncbi:protein RESISTANCE TO PHYTOPHTHORA 1, chloroplastic [Andrographis paniculata]|uniref:protein RESISTANCE TO PHYTOPHTHORA 1, chloroplastic n=1 Tax=Andrographis paniculata TaxID=175694 RepID=UPI0021E94924|nr:protein RESISTANCE TO PHYTOPHTHORA 1, chloroplastic [Andrographis paniculata]
MSALTSTTLYNARFPGTFLLRPRNYGIRVRFPLQGTRAQASSTEPDIQTQQSEEDVRQSDKDQEVEETSRNSSGLTTSAPVLDKDLKKVVQKTAATFAPRASTATKNPAVPGTVLYTVFEVQGYVSLLLGGALSFNLLFPSNEPDLWRLMGMWSIWMFTIPSLRARDCSKNEKEALNYLFLLIPLINIIIPFFWKSFAVVWSADTIAFFGMYTWKLGWLSQKE